MSQTHTRLTATQQQSREGGKRFKSIVQSDHESYWLGSSANNNNINNNINNNNRREFGGEAMLKQKW